MIRVVRFMHTLIQLSHTFVNGGLCPAAVRVSGVDSAELTAEN